MQNNRLSMLRLSQRFLQPFSRNLATKQRNKGAAKTIRRPPSRRRQVKFYKKLSHRRHIARPLRTQSNNRKLPTRFIEMTFKRYSRSSEMSRFDIADMISNFDYGPIFFRFSHKARYLSKITKFIYPTCI